MKVLVIYDQEVQAYVTLLFWLLIFSTVLRTRHYNLWNCWKKVKLPLWLPWTKLIDPMAGRHLLIPHPTSPFRNKSQNLSRTTKQNLTKWFFSSMKRDTTHASTGKMKSHKNIFRWSQHQVSQAKEFLISLQWSSTTVSPSLRYKRESR